MIGCEIIACPYYNRNECTYPDNQCVKQNQPGYGINDLLREIMDLRLENKILTRTVTKLENKRK